MNFKEALIGLQNGEYVYRKLWEKTGEYLVLLPYIKNIWKVNHQSGSENILPLCQNWEPLFVDFWADDWETLDK